MQSKLQELTDKIYNEGVVKAQKEADSIIEKANSEAEAILEAAKQEAGNIKHQAQKKADELKRNIEAEMKLSANQSISSLKQQVAELITQQVIEPSLNEVFSDKSFLQELILKLVHGWTQNGSFDLNLILPESEKEQLLSFIKNSLAQELNKGITLTFDKKLQSGLKISPIDGSYIVSLTEEDFASFFKAFIRPKTNRLLFEEK